MDRPAEPSLLRAPRAFQHAMDEARAQGRRVGFVPTMGALHDGHLALAREARRRVGDTGLVAVSIFVNPTQFGPREDLAKYPRELEADLARCASAGVDAVFAPDATAMYPDGEQTRVIVRALAQPLCGAFRPGHFEGVATIVAKLFALVGRSVAVFGRKDYQQWRVLARMAEDLMLPVEVVGMATVREPDGLARSSRNRYLSAEERARAAAIPRALGDAVRAWESGARDAHALRERAEAALRPIASSMDYVDVRDPDTLAPWTAGDRALLAVALRVGSTRLIDNVVLGEEPPPDRADPAPSSA
jgi:pantoate--beta-alanine ligase